LNDNDTQAETAVPRGGLDVRIAQHLVEQARTEGLELTGPDGLLAAITTNVIQAALEAEMTVQTGVGPVELDLPRDRAGEFEPRIAPKHSRRIDGFDEAVVSLYAKGLTTGEIQAHLAEIYGAEVSRDTISRVTDAVAAELDE
jgi:putative transposase